MKQRNGFVTNSSSSSFIISTNKEIPDKYKNFFDKIDKSKNIASEILKEKYDYVFDEYELEKYASIKEQFNLNDEQMLLMLAANYNLLDDVKYLMDNVKNIKDDIYFMLIDRDLLYSYDDLYDFIKNCNIITKS